MKKSTIKAELVNLYKECPGLAIQTAKVLGYKIVADLDRFLGKYYKNYEFGDPQKAAKILKAVIETAVDDINKALKDAGGFLAPAVFDAFKQDLVVALNLNVNIPKSRSLDEILKERGITKEEFELMKKKM